MAKPLIVIEHLEDHVSRWLMLEYRHAKSLANNRLVFTNGREYCGKLAEIAPCYRESILDLEGILYTERGRVIILDPSADRLLDPEEAARADAIVVGGILGDHPPRRRTWEMLTSRAEGMLARSLGPQQLSIDGAVYVALKALQGVHPSSVPLVHNPRVEIPLDDLVSVEVELPFSYPLVGGRPLFAPGLEELLARGLGYEEARELE
ncbi:SAM-dependent methyltransferase [Pyrodictium abyssi]|uniref:Uncharacterized protein n=1 Tax=Pyrodictium abyssi TaxID=54256 RepID=A0ABM8IV81_9CREN|nr:hypothetical protein PABY_10310 [Pyrodictium abyssi]